MDKMVIETGFTKKIISGLIKRFLKKKFGIDKVRIDFDELRLDFNGKSGSFRVNIEGEFTQDDILKLVKGDGIE